MDFFFKHKRWLWPTIFLIILAPFTPWLDITIENYFYQHGNDPATHFMTGRVIQFMYDKGALILTIIGSLSLPLLLFKKFRKPMMVILLTLIVGSGFVTHALLKDYWGRPRPKQIENYGGSQLYRPFWSPNFFHQPEPSKSFVCGHCSVGFLFLSLIILGQRYRNRIVFWSGIIFSLLFGVGLSLTRMAQGGHFFSDCLFTAFVMWTVALMMNWLVYADENPN